MANTTTRKRGRPQGKPPSGGRLGAILGRALRQRRLSMGLTLDELSDRTLGIVTPSGLAKCEQGHEPRLRNFLALCFAFGCGPDELLGINISKLTKDKLADLTVE